MLRHKVVQNQITSYYITKMILWEVFEIVIEVLKAYFCIIFQASLIANLIFLKIHNSKKW